MFELIIIIFRFVFLIYIGYFLYEGFKITLSEQAIIKINIPISLSKQRLCIIFFHITAFLILSYNAGKFNFNYSTLFLGFAGLVFLISASYITQKLYALSCPLIWNGVFFLIDIGIVILQRLNPEMAKKQLIWFLIGFTLSVVLPFIFNFMPRLDIFKYIYLILGFALLISTLFFGFESGGAVNWINIKGFIFQPSEFVKAIFVFFLASSFSKKPQNIKQLIVPTLVSAIFVLCLVFQTDLGGALIFFMTFMVMLYIATSNTILISIGLGSISLCSVIAYNIFSHVRTRVLIWQNPWKDVEYGGYQIVQSLFAIGTYGLLGCGLTRGFSKYIPVVEKDFIFSAICEEFGVLFAIGMLLIFLMIFLRCIKISLHTSNRFLSLLSSGFTSMLCFQTFLIIGGVTKFIPLTGVTLPFVSYGGSSIIISFIFIGIIQWICTKSIKG